MEVVCLFHWHQLSARNACVADVVGKKQPTFRPGTKWCICFGKNADKIFSAMDYYQMPQKRTRVRSNFMFSLWNEKLFFSFSGFKENHFKTWSNENITPMILCYLWRQGMNRRVGPDWRWGREKYMTGQHNLSEKCLSKSLLASCTPSNSQYSLSVYSAWTLTLFQHAMIAWQRTLLRYQLKQDPSQLVYHEQQLWYGIFRKKLWLVSK